MEKSGISILGLQGMVCAPGNAVRDGGELFTPTRMAKEQMDRHEILLCSSINALLD